MNKDHVVKLFEHFYNKVYRTNFKLDLSLNNQAKVIENFLKLVSQYYMIDSVGVNFMIDYFASAFHYFSTKKLKRNVSLNWIVGRKFFKRYLERKEGQDYYTGEWLRENQINLDQLRASLMKIEEGLDYLKLDKVEELSKGKKADTSARLYNCMTSTTMYNHRSPICLTCHQRVSCKEIMERLLPVVHRERGYGR